MSAESTNLSSLFAEAVERAGEFTVMVKARRRLPATGIVWSADGLIVTANHVVERDEDLIVGLPDGSEVEAELLGRDPSTDLALLRVDASDLTAAPRSGRQARTGELVLAVGKPSNEPPMVAFGAISTIGGRFHRRRRGSSVEQAIRPDLTMYPGFSGGPLIDSAGEVLGMTTTALSRGLPVTLPAATIDRVATALRERGRVARGFLGVALQRVHLPGAIEDQEVGLLITGVEPGGPAAIAGILLGDVLVSIDDMPTSSAHELHDHLGPESVGQRQQAKILRAGQLVDLPVTIGER